MNLLTLPSNREEAWRWSDLSGLPVLADAEPTGAVPDALPWLECGSGPRLLFVSVRVVPAPEVAAGPADRLIAEVGRLTAELEAEPTIARTDVVVASGGVPA